MKANKPGKADAPFIKNKTHTRKESNCKLEDSTPVSNHANVCLAHCFRKKGLFWQVESCRGSKLLIPIWLGGNQYLHRSGTPT